MGPDGRVLLVDSSDSILVRDMTKRRWTCRLMLPPSASLLKSFAFSADGLTLCAIFQFVPASPTAPPTAQLAVWKLPESLRVTVPK